MVIILPSRGSGASTSGVVDSDDTASTKLGNWLEVHEARSALGKLIDKHMPVLYRSSAKAKMSAIKDHLDRCFEARSYGHPSTLAYHADCIANLVSLLRKVVKYLPALQQRAAKNELQIIEKGIYADNC